MRTSIFMTVGVVTLAALFTACSTTPRTVEERDEVKRDAENALADFRHSDNDIAKRIDQAYGLAVFPTVGKGGLGVGGAGGRGVVYEQSTAVGYCTLSQATIGLQIGGQRYSEMILFENRGAFDRFTRGEWAAAAQATAVAAASGAGANARYNDGVMIFVYNQKGLMGEASVGGQKFNYQRFDSTR